MPEPIIPEYITVHLGEPDQSARNIRVPFVDYIKNVASSEIYPTWPESALRANILAQISFALNRVYTEWYRSQGYDFDITNSTKYDQKFIENRELFDPVVKIVDDIFNDYVVKQGSIVPYFTQYCDGKRVNCEGLSQWGTVDLAEQGLVPYEILQNYYGDDINIVFDAPIAENIPSYPGLPLKVGSAGEDVRTIQRQLNRIGDNYPSIPKIPVTNGVFTVQTENAVKKFQEIFNITVDGIVGKSTWYKIKFVYNSVKNLAELSSEGITLEEAKPIYSEVLKQGDTGDNVRVIQYYLTVISYFDNRIPAAEVDGEFGPMTKNAVTAFQQRFGIEPTGEVNRDTWNQLQKTYTEASEFLKKEYVTAGDEIYPGRILSIGMTGDDVSSLQKLIQKISEKNPSVPAVEVTGTFDDQTEQAVRTIQSMNNLPVNGRVGLVTWNRILMLSRN